MRGRIATRGGGSLKFDRRMVQQRGRDAAERGLNGMRFRGGSVGGATEDTVAVVAASGGLYGCLYLPVLIRCPHLAPWALSSPAPSARPDRSLLTTPLTSVPCAPASQAPSTLRLQSLWPETLPL